MKRKTKVVYKLDGDPAEYMYLTSTGAGDPLLETEFRIWRGKCQVQTPATIVRVEKW